MSLTLGNAGGAGSLCDLQNALSSQAYAAAEHRCRRMADDVHASRHSSTVHSGAVESDTPVLRPVTTRDHSPLIREVLNRIYLQNCNQADE